MRTTRLASDDSSFRTGIELIIDAGRARTQLVDECIYRTPRKGKDVTMKLLRKGWDWLATWATALDYDYTDARISGLEHELKKLKYELGRIRMSAGTVDSGFEPSAPVHET